MRAPSQFRSVSNAYRLFKQRQPGHSQKRIVNATALEEFVAGKARILGSNQRSQVICKAGNRYTRCSGILCEQCQFQ